MSRLTLLFWQLMVAVVALSLWQFFASVPVFGKMLLPPFFFSNPVDVGSQIVKWFSTGVEKKNGGSSMRPNTGTEAKNCHSDSATTATINCQNSSVMRDIR